MAQPRSPRYPAIGLPEAIKGVRSVHAKDHLNKVSQEVVAQRMGSSSLNGRALSRISALRKYGLLSGTGDDLQVSQDALIIIADPVGSPERRAAITRAAHRPTLFAKLFKRYPDNVPSDDALRSYLMKEGFTSKGIGKAAKAFLDTVDLVTREGEEYNPADEEPEGKGDVQVQPDAGQLALSSKAPKVVVEAVGSAQGLGTASAVGLGVEEVLRYRLTDVCSAQIQFDGPVNQAAIDKLVGLLNLQKDAYPESIRVKLAGGPEKEEEAESEE
jgi:hypothetical protein